MKNGKLLFGIIFLMILGLGFSVGLGLYKYSLLGRFPAGTKISTIDLSFLTYDEAKKILTTKEEEFLKTPLRITALGKTRTIKPQDLGLNVSVEEPLRALRKISLSGSGTWDIFGFGQKENQKLFAVISLNSDKVFATMEEEFKFREISPVSATASFNNNGELIFTDGKEGTGINRDLFLRDLKSSARDLRSAAIKIETFNQQPAITKSDLLAQEDKIRSSLNQLITLADPIYSDDWQIRLKKHPDWVSFVPKKEFKMPFSGESFFFDPAEKLGEKTVVLQIDQQKVNQFVNENMSKWLDRPAKDVNIYTDEKGKVIIEGRGSDGKKVQREQLKRAIELAAENNIETLTVPTISLTPNIKISQDLKDKGVSERISVGHTSYYGSPDNRVFNIKHGAEKFEGVLIAPDEIFSFNKTLGNVGEETGFRKELVIKPEGTIPDYGGGICQVSTTMYRAALFAGLPIAERNQHTYAVSYYSQILGHGLDATIFIGGPDLKFKNDTGHYLLIQTYTEGDYELYIVLYGTPDGRRVQMEGPYLSNHVNPPADVLVPTATMAPGATKLLEHAHPGFRAIWYRHLFDKEGKESKELIETNYKAMPEKIAVGVSPLPETPKTPTAKPSSLKKP